MSYDLSSLSLTQLERLYCKVWERMTRGNGYQPFGYDWPTLRMTRPGYCDVLQSIRLHALRLLHS